MASNPCSHRFGTTIWDNDPVAVPEHYISRYSITEGASDVNMALGSEYREPGRTRGQCRVRLIMTHDQFLMFAEDVRKEAEFLKRLYGGYPPSLRGTSAADYNTAVDEIYHEDFEPDDDSEKKPFEVGVVFRNPPMSRKSPFQALPNNSSHKAWDLAQTRKPYVRYNDSSPKLPSGVAVKPGHLVRPTTASRSAVPQTTMRSEERFQGRVERVADGFAFLSLVDSAGARSFASYDAASLAASDITEGSRFTCRVTLSGSKAELIFRPVRRERRETGPFSVGSGAHV